MRECKNTQCNQYDRNTTWVFILKHPDKTHFPLITHHITQHNMYISRVRARCSSAIPRHTKWHAQPYGKTDAKKHEGPLKSRAMHQHCVRMQSALCSPTNSIALAYWNHCWRRNPHCCSQLNKRHTLPGTFTQPTSRCRLLHLTIICEHWCDVIKNDLVICFIFAFLE